MIPLNQVFPGAGAGVGRKTFWGLSNMSRFFGPEQKNMIRPKNGIGARDPGGGALGRRDPNDTFLDQNLLFSQGFIR